MLPHFCRCGVSFRGRGRDSEQWELRESIAEQRFQSW